MSIVDVITEGFRTGLPHPGDPDKGQPPRLLILPGMNFHGIPAELMQKFAEDAGLPSPDLPRLLAVALVNLIETTGNCEIVPKPERVVEELPEERTWSSSPYKFRNAGE